MCHLVQSHPESRTSAAVGIGGFILLLRWDTPVADSECRPGQLCPHLWRCSRPRATVEVRFVPLLAPGADASASRTRSEPPAEGIGHRSESGCAGKLAMPTTLSEAVSQYLRFGNPAQGTRSEYQTTVAKWELWGGGVSIEVMGTVRGSGGLFGRHRRPDASRMARFGRQEQA